MVFEVDFKCENRSNTKVNIHKTYCTLSWKPEKYEL